MEGPPSSIRRDECCGGYTSRSAAVIAYASTTASGQSVKSAVAVAYATSPSRRFNARSAMSVAVAYASTAETGHIYIARSAVAVKYASLAGSGQHAGSAAGYASAADFGLCKDCGGSS